VAKKPASPRRSTSSPRKGGSAATRQLSMVAKTLTERTNPRYVALRDQAGNDGQTVVVYSVMIPNGCVDATQIPMPASALARIGPCTGVWCRTGAQDQFILYRSRS
jgi:hypothetical protein